MISQEDGLSAIRTSTETAEHALVRYGVIPQVARYDFPGEPDVMIDRGSTVVVETDRGVEVGQILEIARGSLAAGHEVSGMILRVATREDVARAADNERLAAEEFARWDARIEEWNLDLQLVDLEMSLDRERTILYVLNDRGAETTRLALLAAAAGLGIISVQPVAADGIVLESGGGGCGSGGCGSGGGCSH